MELSLQHQHISNQSPSISLKSEQSKSKKNINKQSQNASTQQPQSVFFVPTLILPVTSSYNFYIDGLEENLRLSENELGQNVIEAIKERKKFSEKRIYQAIVNTSYDFVGVHLKETKQGLKIQMHNLFQTIHNSVQAGIWDGQYEINKRNVHLETFRTTLVRIAGNNNSYLIQLKNQLKETQKTLDKNLTLNSGLRTKEQQKSKQAQQFVRKMQSQQAKHKEQMQRLREERRSLQIRSLQQKKVMQQEKKRQHQSAIRHRIERYKEIKTLQNEHKKKIHSQYLRFISSAKKPLFKKMEEGFDRKMAEEQKEKFKLMRKLMNERKPISFQEINEHMEKYQELLYQNEQFRQQKRELKQNEMQIIASQKPYRSKFYSLVVDTAKKYNQTDNESTLQRQMDFADYVRKNFVPKIDQAKQEEIDNLIKRITTQKNNVHSRKYMEEGKKNLEKLHMLIGELRAKNKIKQAQPPLQITEVPRKYINYLEDAKKSRTLKAGTQVSIDYDKQLQSKDHQTLKMEALRRENKAKQKDHYLSSSVETMDFDSHMKGRSSVEKDYLEAARAKMAILRKFKGDTDSISQKNQTQQ